MATDCIAQVQFKFEKPVVARFDVPGASADGGAVLLKALDRQLGVTEAVASCLRDRRQPGKVQHAALDLVRQRIFGLACGYADGNDAARLADDALHKLLLDRDPLAGPALASQPTLSRFENAPGVAGPDPAGPRAGRPGDRAALRAAAGAGAAHHDRRRSHRRPHPRPAGVRLLQRPLRHLVLPAPAGLRDLQRRGRAVLALRPAAAGHRPGEAGAARPAAACCSASSGRPSRASGCACGWTAASRARTCWAFWRPRGSSTWWPSGAIGAWTSGPGASWGGPGCSSKASGETEHLFGETRYAARKWRRQRRVIIKAEVVRHPGRTPKNNPRFVVTNLPHTPGARLRRSTEGAGMWRTGSRSSRTAWPWTA